MLALIFQAIKNRFVEHMEAVAAARREEAEIEQQVDALMQEYGWNYSKAFAVYMCRHGKWEL